MRFFLLFLCCSVQLMAQSSSSKWSLSPLVGFRMHNDASYGFEIVTVFQKHVLTSPTFGLVLSKKGFPLQLSWQSDFHTAFTTGAIDSTRLGSYRITRTRYENQIQAYYTLKKVSIGLGYYWRREENLLNHLSPNGFIYKYTGLQVACNIPFDWLELECRYHANLTPLSVGIWDHLSFMTLWRIGKKKQLAPNTGKWEVLGLLGGRLFPTKNIERLYGERYNPFGMSPLIGLEVFNKRYRFSLGAEKDWYIALNGGGLYRDVKAHIQSTFLSAGYHFKTSNNRNVRVRLGMSLIQDSDKAEDLEFNAPINVQFYQVKGVGTALSYEAFPNTDIEIKHTFPWIGDKLFNTTRLSLGLIYRYRPFKK